MVLITFGASLMVYFGPELGKSFSFRGLTVGTPRAFIETGTLRAYPRFSYFWFWCRRPLASACAPLIPRFIGHVCMPHIRNTAENVPLKNPHLTNLRVRFSLGKI